MKEQKITMSASVIKMSRAADNMSRNVKTLLTENATFLKSNLIKYHERRLMNDVTSVGGHSSVFNSHTAVG